MFEQITSFAALHGAALRAVRGKRKKPGASAFFARLEFELLRLQRELQSATYRPGRYTEIHVRDPKPRLVSAAPFRDRVVHHALCHVVGPVFERGFIEDSYANRKGKGTHRALARYEYYRDRHPYVLRADIFRFFPAIDHAVLKRDLRRRIVCPQTLWLLDTIIDGSNQQEPVEIYFPGDDLFAPFNRRRGLPIGNLSSQTFGNIYLNPLDHYAKEVLRAPYVRYVDDFALFASSADTLQAWRHKIECFLEKRRLLLHPRKTGVMSTQEPAEFLGFVLIDRHLRRLPQANVTRFRNRLRGLRDRWRHGHVEKEIVIQRINAWVAHAEHANTRRLRHALFLGGWFDPYWDQRLEACPIPVSSRPARRVLEQHSTEGAFRQPQQEQSRQSEQQ